MSKMKNITTSVLHGVSTRKGKQILFHSGPGRAGDNKDTDKAFHMSFDEVTFNADRIRSKLELLSEELMPRCGLVYELYQLIILWPHCRQNNIYWSRTGP